MSKESQERFLSELDEYLKVSVAAYRRYQANKVTHVFTVTKKALARGIVDTLKKSNVDRKQIAELLAAIKPDINNVFNLIKDRARGRFEGENIIVGKVIKDTDQRFVGIFMATKQENGRARGIYAQVFRTYGNQLDAFAKIIAQKSEEIIGQSYGSKAKNYYNLEHAQHQGIAESQIRDGIYNAAGELNDIDVSEVKKWLSSRGIDLRLIRNTKTDTMSVFIGSKHANIEEGGAVRSAKTLLTDLVKESRKFLEDNEEKILDMPGSDSFTGIVRKQTIESVVKKFKQKKGVKVKHENIKYTLKKDDTTKKAPKQKNTIAKSLQLKAVGAAGAPRRTGKRTPKPKIELAQILGILNNQLPKQVAANMGSPRLENRTGRFAQSVRALDVSRTAQGFPSIGYTYMKDRYGHYESTSGSRFADADRDPRPLIDQSIREIVIGFGLGRLYTRRV